MKQHVSFDGYSTDGFHDEYFVADGTPRPEYVSELRFRDTSAPTEG